MSDSVIERAVAAVADRAPVEWETLEGDAHSDQEREYLNVLRIVDGIADLHRRAGRDAGPWHDPEESSEQLSEATTEEARPWGRYRLVEKVGEGSFGSVYRAWDPDLEREVAIKILHRRIADARLKERLLHEGRALAKIRHPHVVNVLGVESDGDQVALCMEFVEGETLEQTLRANGPMSAREAAVVGEEVCRALAAVHFSGFVHRDVKARNVMREKGGRIVLMDFGTGREADRLHLAGRADMVGTPLYMAPEVLAGQPASPCSDVYSVGVLLYHLVTGEYPVNGRTVEELKTAHMQGRRHLLSDRRPELTLSFVQVIDRAIAADPDRRYASPGVLLEALGATLGANRRTHIAIRALGTLAGTVVATVCLGLLTTAAFNMTVGRRAPFDSEPAMTSLLMGLRSLFTPVLYIGVMVVIVWIAKFAIRMLSTVGSINAILHGVRRRVATLSAALGLDDPVAFGQIVTILGVAAIAVVMWRFSDLLRAFTAWTISESPADLLRPLQPPHVGSLYRLALDVLIFAFCAAIFRIARLSARHPAKLVRAAAPIGVLLAIVIVMNEFPYRILWYSRAERIAFGEDRCYILGQAAAEALIYCPERQPPRNQVIDVNDPAVHRPGIVESIFSPPETPR